MTSEGCVDGQHHRSVLMAVNNACKRTRDVSVLGAITALPAAPLVHCPGSLLPDAMDVAAGLGCLVISPLVPCYVHLVDTFPRARSDLFKRCLVNMEAQRAFLVAELAIKSH